MYGRKFTPVVSGVSVTTGSTVSPTGDPDDTDAPDAPGVPDATDDPDTTDVNSWVNAAALNSRNKGPTLERRTSLWLFARMLRSFPELHNASDKTIEHAADIWLSKAQQPITDATKEDIRAALVDMMHEDIKYPRIAPALLTAYKASLTRPLPHAGLGSPARLLRLCGLLPTNTAGSFPLDQVALGVLFCCDHSSISNWIKRLVKARLIVKTSNHRFKPEPDKPARCAEYRLINPTNN